jgi:hypothetical protein
MDSGSLESCICVNALRGTGVATVDAVAPDPAPPEDAPPEAPAAEEDVAVERVVPLEEVFALEEMLPLVLAEESTLPDPEVLAVDSAEVDCRFRTVELADVVALPSADVEATEDVPAALAEGLRSELPAEAPPPAPAPEDDPAVAATGAANTPAGVDACT